MGSVRKRQLAALAFVAVFGFILFLLGKTERTELYGTQGRSFEKARVLEVLEDNEQESGQYVGQQKVLLVLDSGSRKGETVEAVSSSSYLYGAHCRPGMRVIAAVNESGEELYVTVYSQDRSLVLYGIVALFLISVWAIGGRQGLNSAIGLIFTFLCIIFMFIPMIYRGASPIGASMLVAALTTVVTMYLIGGRSTKTAAAILATILGVMLSGSLAAAFGRLAGISGYNVSDIEQLEYVAQMTDIKVGELLYAGILISALGAIMDVAMSVSSAVHEVAARAPELGFKELFRSGIHVGRDMMGTMSNTLILAYIGGSLTIVLLFFAYNHSLLYLLNKEMVVVEILQAVIGSFGILFTIPFTSFICSRLYVKKAGRRHKSGLENKI